MCLLEVCIWTLAGGVIKTSQCSKCKAISIQFAPYKGRERVTGPLSRAKVLYNWTMFLHWIWIIGNLDCQWCHLFWEADVNLCKYAIVNLCKYSQLRAHSIVRLIIVVGSLISPHKGSTSLESEQKHLLHLLSYRESSKLQLFASSNKNFRVTLCRSLTTLSLTASKVKAPCFTKFHLVLQCFL